MKHIRIPFLVVAVSLALMGLVSAGAAPVSGMDIPGITSWTMRSGDTFAHNTAGASGLIPGINSLGVGGGGPGIGDLLLSPLYDVRTITNPELLPAAAGAELQAQYTMFCIVNTDTTHGVVARLRFREWKRSIECLDLDIPLTTRDVWCGSVENIAGTPTLFSAVDRYVTNVVGVYPDHTDFTAAVVPAAGIPFRAYLIENQDISRCQYGYFEIISEERVSGWNAAKTLFYRLADVAVPNTATDRDVDNVLMGTTYIIRPDQRISHQYNMSAIGNFAIDARGIYNPPTGDRPNLPNDVQGEHPGGGIAQNPGNGGLNDLEALISKRRVNFQYVVGLDPADPSNTPMSTSLIVTLPTKWVHYNREAPRNILDNLTWPGGTPFLGPYETPGDAPALSYGGEVINYSLWDREEHAFGVPPDQPISPPPQQTPNIPILPYEVNVIGFYPVFPAPGVPYFRNNLNISTQNTSVTPIQTFYAGWGFLDLSPDEGFITGDPRGLNITFPPLVQDHVQGEDVSYNPNFSYFPNFSFFNNLFTHYRGLPAMGIVMTEFYNDTIDGYYGNTVPWQYNVDWWTP